jgi:hypothetical protein
LNATDRPPLGTFGRSCAWAVLVFSVLVGVFPSTGKVWREFMFYRGYYAGTPQTPLGWFSWRMEWDDAEPQRETAAIPDPC